jgi:hypothetical protein
MYQLFSKVVLKKISSTFAPQGWEAEHAVTVINTSLVKGLPLLYTSDSIHMTANQQLTPTNLPAQPYTPHTYLTPSRSYTLQVLLTSGVVVCVDMSEVYRCYQFIAAP